MDERGAGTGAAAIAAAAEALVGCRFRMHGRDPAHGVDCIGLVLAAHRAAGIGLDAPDDYPLRGWPRRWVDTWAVRAGLIPVAGAPRPGDVLLTDAGFGQWHFAVMGRGAAIHADARRRCVVATPWGDDAHAAVWRARDIAHEGERPWLHWS